MKKTLVFLSLIIVSFCANAQIFDISRVKQPGAGPAIALSPSSFNSFTTTAGTASANQTTNVTGTNLTANITVTCVSGYEISTDGSTWVTTTRTITQSGGNASGTIYCRLLASNTAGTYSGNLAFSSTGAITVNIALSGQVNASSPAITRSPTSLSGFSTTSGTPSASQSFTASGQFLFSDITVTAPASYEVSLDNSSFASSKTLTQTGGTVNTTTVYVRITSGASAGSPSGNVALTSTSATTQNVAVSGTVTSAGSKDSTFINLDTTQLMSVGAGWKNMTGDPSKNVFSVTNTSGAITVTSVATANWIPYSGNSAFPNNGNTGYTAFPAQAVKECWYSYNGGVSNNDPYNSGKPKFHVSGLNTGSQYTIIIGGSFTYNFLATTEYRVKGSVLTGPTSFDCKNNTSTVATFTNISPDGSGNIDIFVNGANNQEMGVVSAIQIKEQ